MNTQYALITGASGGIGLELAHIAASKGVNLILAARSVEKMMQLRKELEESYSVRVLVAGCDLSLPEAPEKIRRLLEEQHIVPDMLINNAGFGLFGAFHLTPAQRENEMLQVNVVALTVLTKMIYTKMRERGSGCILNVASVAGFMPGPLMAVYYATKAYVRSFSEALANEAGGSNVRVTALCPGPTLSGFEAAAGAENSRLFRSFGRLPTARQVALFGWKRMMKGKPVAVHGWKNRLIVFLIRFLPRTAVTDLVRTVQNPVKSN
ncbi:MAG: SDR family oxidoreductase [Bacteroidales bacterium]|jgi:short-subunit dehydrogenase|nr:SDR family oxidoreductase [Bacteroidales bacterium]